MAKQQSIAQARNSLPTLVREAESGSAIRLTRHGEPVAVLLGSRYYEQLTRQHRPFSAAYGDFRREVDLRELDIDPDVVFARPRDTDRGRKVRL